MEREVRVMDIGPLQLLVVSFAHPKVDGSILKALVEASAEGSIRVVDGVAVMKDEDGTVFVDETTDIPMTERGAYGRWVGALVGLTADPTEVVDALLDGQAATDEHPYGIHAEGLADIADDIAPGGGALVLVIDHQWAVPLRKALEASGGTLVIQDFLSPEALTAVFGATE